MKITALLLFLFLHTILPSNNYVFSQESNASIGSLGAVPIQSKYDIAIISAEQNKLVQLAKLDGFDLTRQDWTHEEIPVCPAFSKHFFVGYQESREKGASFTAIYSRTGNGIYVIPQSTSLGLISRFSAIRRSTISTFNAILSVERGDLKVKAQMHDSDWVSLARCYARLAGERPVADSDNASIYAADGPKQQDVESDHLSRVAIEVLGKPLVITTLSLSFNKQGFIERVIRTESANLSDAP